MSDGNKRYLGDVLINGENYDRQKQFFRDIIESYQWKYGGSFDASTLQGQDPSNFATKAQGEKADRALLGPICFGDYTRQPIENITDPQYIFSDAVKIDRVSEKIDGIDWYEDLDDDDITDALASIYDNVTTITNSLDDNKLDASTYNTFYTDDYTPIKDIILSSFQTIINENNEQEAAINATLVNGLRFILITQQAYNNLPDSKKNFWRNVYIIKDSAEIPADYSSPLELDLSDGYEFRVYNGNLQVSNILSDSWKNICTLDQLLEGANIDNIVKDFIEDQDYTIKPSNFLTSLQSVSPATVDENPINYPFISRNLQDDFVKSITINDSSSNVTTSTINGFKNVNLDINSYITTQTASLLTDLQDARSRLLTAEQDLITQTNNIQTVNQRVNTVSRRNDTQDELLETISENIRDIRVDISNINSNINDILYGLSDHGWARYDFTDLPDSEGHNVSYNLYNETLKIAIFYYGFSHYFLAKSWSRYSGSNGEEADRYYTPSKKKGSYSNQAYSTTRVKAIPICRVPGVNETHPFETSLEVDGDGYIKVKKNEDERSGYSYFGGSVIYKYSELI